MNAIKELLNKIWLNKKDVRTKYVEDTEEVRGYTFRSLDVSAIESVLPQLQDEASKLDMSRILSMNEHYIKNMNENDLFNQLIEYCNKFKKEIRGK